MTQFQSSGPLPRSVEFMSRTVCMYTYWTGSSMKRANQEKGLKTKVDQNDLAIHFANVSNYKTAKNNKAC